MPWSLPLSSVGPDVSIIPGSIGTALRSLKHGKYCGCDGISAENYVFADKSLHVLLSLLFSSLIVHGYISDMFMKNVLVPLIKNKSGDSSDVNNYRPVALVTCASKVFDIVFNGGTTGYPLKSVWVKEKSFHRFVYLYL